MDEYYQAVRALPTWLAAPLAQLPVQTAVRVQELRLRIGCAVTFTVQGRQCAASVLPGCPPALAAMRLDALQIEEIFYTLCNGSVHTHERELAEGYLTTAAGNRVGVAGQFVQREGPVSYTHLSRNPIRRSRCRTRLSGCWKSGSEVNNEIWNDEKEIFMMMNFKKNQNNAVCSMDCKNCPNGASQPNPMDDSMFEKSIAMLHNLSLIHISAQPRERGEREE